RLEAGDQGRRSVHAEPEQRLGRVLAERVGEAEPAGQRDARVDVELHDRTAGERARGLRLRSDDIARNEALVAAIRGAQPEVAAELEEAARDGEHLALERVARVEVRRADLVLAPSQKYRAD